MQTARLPKGIPRFPATHLSILRAFPHHPRVPVSSERRMASVFLFQNVCIYVHNEHWKVVVLAEGSPRKYVGTCLGNKQRKGEGRPVLVQKGWCASAHLEPPLETVVLTGTSVSFADGVGLGPRVWKACLSILPGGAGGGGGEVRESTHSSTNSNWFHSIPRKEAANLFTA